MSAISSFTGHPLPLGATPRRDYVQFAIFSRHAEQVSLLLFDDPDDDTPSHEIVLDPRLNRTGDIWHIAVHGLSEGQLYLYRIDGPYLPHLGHRYNGHKGLIDPYARALSGTMNSHHASLAGYRWGSDAQDLSFSTMSNLGQMPKCVVVRDDFDWQGDVPLNRSLRETIIYEAHVRGLTQHPSARLEAPGTYAGIVELIPYLLELGVTAIELLPVQSFDQSADGRMQPHTGQPLSNYWGYNTVNFFAPEAYYSRNGSLGDQVREFKYMVRELHKAGLEVILDVVYNHTGEGNQKGPTYSFRGIDNLVYYLLESDKRYYRNYAGTGNTFNCNHPVIRDLILDSLRYWVMEMHVDGFRFDLASVLGRDQRGNLLENPPIVERIAEDPILRDTKIIAEAWDAAGAYQVGSFPGGRWAEWNGRYRDDIRRFWRGDSGTLGALATRFAGSSDLYLRDGRAPFHSINFITSHDGFTLNDLVSYNRKHNFDNGENNRDGDNNNYSDNLGVEGPTTNKRIETYRLRRLKNFMATLMLSQGVPMLLAGDEFRRTQQGNNNAYAQNNEISWIDWTFQKKNADFFRFTREVISLRKRHPIFNRAQFFRGGDSQDIQWFSAACTEADWSDYNHTLMVLIYGHNHLPTEGSDADALVMFNSSWSNQVFTLPAAPRGRVWRLAIDTALPSPQDIAVPGREKKLSSSQAYTVQAQSMVVLLSYPQS